MKNVTILEFNVYATNDVGRNFRAVKIAGSWRLAVETKPGYQWDFVNDIKYSSGIAAIMDCDRY